ncbi:MAG: M61 family peptidase, partial [Saprospiraceae bacterium]|nr:M61 family peptidase [Saprospiraceae bacterium]
MHPRLFFPTLLLLLAFLPLEAQEPIIYRLDLSNIDQHELKITVEFTSLNPQEILNIRMSQASPGRYALHNFAKNVYDTYAYGHSGEVLDLYRSDENEWQVTGHEGYVRFQYTLFGNHADGTYTGINNRMIHLNMPATFVYGVGLEKRSVELFIDLNEYPEWTVATQLPTSGRGTFTAPDYYYFLDSPLIAGDLDHRSWQVIDGADTSTIEIAMLHEGSSEQLDEYTEWVKQIVAEQTEIFGSLPGFDYGRYTFLLS